MKFETDVNLKTKLKLNVRVEVEDIHFFDGGDELTYEVSLTDHQALDSVAQDELTAESHAALMRDVEERLREAYDNGDYADEE